MITTACQARLLPTILVPLLATGYLPTYSPTTHSPAPSGDFHVVYPRTHSQRPRPLVIVSPGFGADSRGYAWMASEHWVTAIQATPVNPFPPILTDGVDLASWNRRFRAFWQDSNASVTYGPLSRRTLFVGHSMGTVYSMRAVMDSPQADAVAAILFAPLVLGWDVLSLRPTSRVTWVVLGTYDCTVHPAKLQAARTLENPNVRFISIPRANHANWAQMRSESSSLTHVPWCDDRLATAAQLEIGRRILAQMLLPQEAREWGSAAPPIGPRGRGCPCEEPAGR